MKKVFLIFGLLFFLLGCDNLAENTDPKTDSDTQSEPNDKNDPKSGTNPSTTQDDPKSDTDSSSNEPEDLIFATFSEGIQQIELTDDYLYALVRAETDDLDNIKSGSRIVRIPFESGEEETLITMEPPRDWNLNKIFAINSDGIWWTEPSDKNTLVYFAQINELEPQLLCTIEEAAGEIHMNSTHLYVLSTDGKTIFNIDKATGEIEEITFNSKVYSMLVTEENLFISLFGSLSIQKMDPLDWNQLTIYDEGYNDLEPSSGIAIYDYTDDGKLIFSPYDALAGKWSLKSYDNIKNETLIIASVNQLPSNIECDMDSCEFLNAYYVNEYVYTVLRSENGTHLIRVPIEPGEAEYVLKFKDNYFEGRNVVIPKRNTKVSETSVFWSEDNSIMRIALP